MRGSSSTRLSLGNFQPNSPNRTSRVEVVDRTELRTRDWTHSGLSWIGTESVFINAAVSAGDTHGRHVPSHPVVAAIALLLFGLEVDPDALVLKGRGAGSGLARQGVV